MSTLLEERPIARDREVTVRVVTEENRRGGGGRGFGGGNVLTTAGLGAIAVAIMLVVGAITGLVDVGNLFGGGTVDRSPPVVVKELRNLSDYTAAEGIYNVDVILDGNVPILPDFIMGEDVTFRGVGSVGASIDFDQLATDAVRVSEDGAGGRTVVINLAAPRLADPALDLAKSRVLSRELGLFDKIGQMFDEDPGYERELYLKAENKIARAARQSGLEERAKVNTETMLQAFLGRLGFEQVTITWDDPPARAAKAKAAGK